MDQLRFVDSLDDVRLSLNNFAAGVAKNLTRARKIVVLTTFWVFDPTPRSFGPSKFVGFKGMNFSDYEAAGDKKLSGESFDGTYTWKAIESASGRTYQPNAKLRVELRQWIADNFGADTAAGIDEDKWKFLVLPASGKIAFDVGKIYKRTAIHNQFGGQRQGGISTPKNHDAIFIFTGAGGRQHGYFDQRLEEGVLLYTGEGQYGDMKFDSGNRAIRDHEKNGKAIHVFEQAKKGFVRYLGQMVCTGYDTRRGPDTAKKEREVIVFELAPVEIARTTHENEPQGEVDLEDTDESLEDLRKEALKAATGSQSPKQGSTNLYKRSQSVKKYVLKRANGTCEACEEPAPFKTAKGRPYLEPHHILRLSDGGPDHPDKVAGVCPNCHRRAHYASDRIEFNKSLLVKIESRLASAKCAGA